MYLQMQRCSNCNISSFEPGFLNLGGQLRLNSTGEQIDLCGDCVGHLEMRRNMYQLKPEFRNPNINLFEITDDGICKKPDCPNFGGVWGDCPRGDKTDV